MMSRPALLLAAALALTALPTYAQNKPPQQPLPGGPAGTTLPDLVVDSLTLSLNQNPGPCIKYHVARLDVHVTIRNVGSVTAIMKPGNDWNPWVIIVSKYGNGDSFIAEKIHGTADQIPPNGTRTFFRITAAPVDVPLSKASSTVTVYATVNLAKLITSESNYGNNTKQVTQTFKGELCKLVAPLRSPPPAK